VAAVALVLVVERPDQAALAAGAVLVLLAQGHQGPQIRVVAVVLLLEPEQLMLAVLAAPASSSSSTHWVLLRS
jgi:hypothetical protein